MFLWQVMIYIRWKQAFVCMLMISTSFRMRLRYYDIDDNIWWEYYIPYHIQVSTKSTDLILATFLVMHSLKTFWIRCNKVMGILKYGNTSKIPFQTLSKTLYYGCLLNPSPCVSFQSVVIKSFNWRVSFWKIHTLWCSLFKN